MPVASTAMVSATELDQRCIKRRPPCAMRLRKHRGQTGAGYPVQSLRSTSYTSRSPNVRWQRYRASGTPFPRPSSGRPVRRPFELLPCESCLSHLSANSPFFCVGRCDSGQFRSLRARARTLLVFNISYNPWRVKQNLSPSPHDGTSRHICINRKPAAKGKDKNGPFWFIFYENAGKVAWTIDTAIGIM